MSNTEIDPIIAELANPNRIAPKVRQLVRYHRPTVETMVSDGIPKLIERDTTVITPYDVIFAAMDGLAKRSIHPNYSRGLVLETVRLALEDFPGYERIENDRLAQAVDMAAELTKKGKKVILTEI